MNELIAQVFQYVNAVWRRRWIAIAVTWLAVLPGWLFVSGMPDIYKSSSRIYVDSSSVLQPLLRGIAVANDLRTQIRLMQQTLLSRPNLEEVARKTDYDLSVTSEVEMVELLEKLRTNTVIASNRSNIFLISFEDSNPTRARDVVQALLTIFVEGNLGESRVELDTAREFIDQQIAEYEARLKEAEDKLATFKQSNIDVVLGDGSYLGRATAANKVLQQVEQDLNVAIAQRDLLTNELRAIPETLPSNLLNTGPPDDTAFRIAEMESTIRELLSRYTEKHPDVVSKRRQLDALLAKATASEELAQLDENAGAESPASYGAPNPIYGELKLRLVEIQTRIESLRRRAATARTQAEAFEAKAEEVPRIEAAYKSLNRDYGVVKKQYNALLSRRESALVSRNRDAVGQDVQYRVIDPATVPVKPIGPDRALLLSVVLGVSAVVGLGVAFAIVLLDGSFSTVAELRDFTGLPVVGFVTVNQMSARVGAKLADVTLLSCSLVGLGLAFGFLLIVERQYGLSSFVSTDFGPDMLEGVVQSVTSKFFNLIN